MDTRVICLTNNRIRNLKFKFFKVGWIAIDKLYTTMKVYIHNSYEECTKVVLSNYVV
jgi:hypothetical protein